MAVTTVYPLSYAKNDCNRGCKHQQWLAGIGKSLAGVRAHIKRIEMFECLEGKTWAGQLLAERASRIARVEEELAMERLHEEALQLMMGG